MSVHTNIPGTKLYLAPLQGFTDYAFRQAFSSLFGIPDAAFSPFIETHKPDQRMYRDVLPERNPGYRLVPQILGNSAAEMKPVIARLHEMGYTEINWNLGCPYPMVTKKQMGAGLLPYPEKIDEILDVLFAYPSLKLSVKMRLGLTSFDEWKALVSVLNRYPLAEVIIHGRTAKQMYKGEVNEDAFIDLARQLFHPVCYNGNINTLEQYQSLSKRMPFISRWMLGRGLIANPLLTNEIRSNSKSGSDEIKAAIFKLHDQLMYQNSVRLNGESHLMNKMKPYWEYFAQSLAGSEKGLKKIKKSWNLETYTNACHEIKRG